MAQSQLLPNLSSLFLPSSLLSSLPNLLVPELLVTTIQCIVKVPGALRARSWFIKRQYSGVEWLSAQPWSWTSLGSNPNSMALGMLLNACFSFPIHKMG